MRPQFTVLSLAVATTYFVAARYSLSLATVHIAITPVWPPTALALVAILHLGYRILPAIALGALAINFYVTGSFPIALGIASGNCLEALCGALVVHRYIGYRDPLACARDLFTFIVGAGIVSTTISATIGVATLYGLQDTPPSAVPMMWLTWWLGDMMGALIFAPALLAWVNQPRPGWSRIRLAEGALLLTGLAVVTEVAFGAWSLRFVGDASLIFLLFPVLVWAAFRFGSNGVAVVITVIAALAVRCTSHGSGPFVRSSANESFLTLELFLGTLAVATFAMAALLRERDAIAEKLLKSNAELERFAYVASHDLQEPLRTISLFCQMLKRRLPDDGSLEEYFTFIIQGTARMKTLIVALLEYSRVGHAAAYRPTDAARAWDFAVQNLLGSIRGAQAQVSQGDLPFVYADPAQLASVFQNLIANAIKFRGEDTPRVHVSAQRRGRFWTFSVADNGKGIAPQFFTKLFKPFARLETGPVPGTGMGLATCRKIVEQNGGTIWLDSAAERGTTFYFTVPVVPPLH